MTRHLATRLPGTDATGNRAEGWAGVGDPKPEPGLRPRIMVGLATILALVFGIGGWAALASISGAVVASGMIVVDSNIKKVQHPYGGIVRELRVKNGDAVAAGDIVMVLDDTQVQANLGIVVSQLIELTGRKARLEAERDDAAAIALPEGFEVKSPQARRIAEGERRLLEARRASVDGQRGQFKERIEQLKLEVEGLTAQRTSKALELSLVRDEFTRVDDMFKRKLTPFTRVLAMQRDIARIEGEHGALTAQLGRTGGQINEVGLQILSLEQTQRTEAHKELRDIEGRIAELAERRVAAQDQLKRIEIRSPQKGLVHDLAVHTVGGVIGAAETAMMIVPSNERLTIEVRIQPQDIDQIRLDQGTILRFTAFNQRTTPEVRGKISRVAADLTREPQTGAVYFVARVAINDDELVKIKGLLLVPGMPVEALVETDQRTALSYLVKPITDQMNKALREE